MNKNLLMSILARHGDKQADLAAVLGLSLSRTNAKINETDGAQFYQSEIATIKHHYGLTAGEVDSIFLTQKCLKKTR